MKKTIAIAFLLAAGVHCSSDPCSDAATCVGAAPLPTVLDAGLDAPTADAAVVPDGGVIVGGPEFTPKKIASLFMWLDPSDPANRTSAGAKVTGLKDKSGNGHDATSAAREPSLDPPLAVAAINGRDTLAFDAASYLVLGDFSALKSGEIFIVLRPPAKFVTRGLWFMSALISATNFPDTDGHVRDGWGAATRHDIGELPLVTSPHVYNAISTSDEWSAGFDGVQQFTTATNAVTFHSFGWLGMSSDAVSFFSGDVGEVVMFGAKLTTPEHEAVLAYLRRRWATP